MSLPPDPNIIAIDASVAASRPGLGRGRQATTKPRRRRTLRRCAPPVYCRDRGRLLAQGTRAGEARREGGSDDEARPCGPRRFPDRPGGLPEGAAATPGAGPDRRRGGLRRPRGAARRRRSPRPSPSSRPPRPRPARRSTPRASTASTIAASSRSTRRSRPSTCSGPASRSSDAVPPPAGPRIIRGRPALTRSPSRPAARRSRRLRAGRRRPSPTITGPRSPPALLRSRPMSASRSKRWRRPGAGPRPRASASSLSTDATGAGGERVHTCEVDAGGRVRADPASRAHELRLPAPRLLRGHRRRWDRLLRQLPEVHRAGAHRGADRARASARPTLRDRLGVVLRGARGDGRLPGPGAARGSTSS